MFSLRTLSGIGALLGALAVATGAFGTHALTLTPDQVATWKTASQYHLAHAALMVVVGLVLKSKAAFAAVVLFLFGVVLFSGSLYALVLTNVKWLGAVAPVGGALLISGWIALAIATFGGNLHKE